MLHSASRWETRDSYLLMQNESPPQLSGFKSQTVMISQFLGVGNPCTAQLSAPTLYSWMRVESSPQQGLGFYLKVQLEWVPCLSSFMVVGRIQILGLLDLEPLSLDDHWLQPVLRPLPWGPLPGVIHSMAAGLIKIRENGREGGCWDRTVRAEQKPPSFYVPPNYFCSVLCSRFHTQGEGSHKGVNARRWGLLGISEAASHRHKGRPVPCPPVLGWHTSLLLACLVR